MNLRNFTIVVLRILAIWFVGTGLAAIGHDVIETVTLAGIRIGSSGDSFNWFALIWLVSPLINIVIGSVLWRFAPALSTRVLSENSADTDDAA